MYTSGRDPTALLGAQQPMGIIVHTYQSTTAYGHLQPSKTSREPAGDSTVPFLGVARNENKTQNAHHGVSSSQPSATSPTGPMPPPRGAPRGTPNSMTRTAPLNLQTSPGRPVYILNSEKSLFRLAVLWKVIKSNSVFYVTSILLLTLEKGLLPSIYYFQPQTTATP